MESDPTGDVDDVDREEAEQADQDGAAEVKHLVVVWPREIEPDDVAQRHVRDHQDEHDDIDRHRRRDLRPLREAREERRDPERGETIDAIEDIAAYDRDHRGDQDCRSQRGASERAGCGHAHAYCKRTTAPDPSFVVRRRHSAHDQRRDLESATARAAALAGHSRRRSHRHASGRFRRG